MKHQYDDVSKDILARYGLYEYTEQEQQQRAAQQEQERQRQDALTRLQKRDQKTAAMAASDRSTPWYSKPVQTLKQAGQSLAQSVRRAGAQKEQADWEKALQQTAREKVSGYTQPEKLRGSQYDDVSRQILAEYGLADFTAEELYERQLWNDRRNAYSIDAQHAADRLGTLDWGSYAADADNRDALDRQLEQLRSEMQRVGPNSANYWEMRDYYGSLRKLRDAYDAREQAAGYATNQEEYDAAQQLDAAYRQLGTEGWDEWQNDSQYQAQLALQLTAAQRALDQAKPGSKRAKELQERVDALQGMQAMYTSRADYYGQFADRADWEDYQRAGELFDAGHGQQAAGDLERAQAALEASKEDEARLQLQIDGLQSSGYLAFGNARRLQDLYTQLQSAKSKTKELEAQVAQAQRIAGYVQDRVTAEQAMPWKQEVASRQEAAKARGESNRDVSLQAKAEFEAAKAKYTAAKEAADAARSQNMAELQGYQQFIPDGTTPEAYERQLSESVYWYGDGTGEVILPDGRHLSGEEDYILGEIDAEVQKYRKMVQTGRELEEAYKEYSRAENIYNYAKASQYSDLQTADDYQQLVEAGKAAFAPVEQQTQQARDQRVAEANYGNSETAGFNEAGSDFYTYRTPDDSFTEQERNTWYALYGRDPEEAYEYAIGIHQRNRTQSREQQEQDLAEWAGKNAGTRTAAFVGSVLTFPTAAWDYLGDVVEYGNTGLIMPRTELTPTDWTDAMSSGAAQSLNEKYGTIHADGNLQFLDGKGLGDVYQLGQSIAQSMTVAGLGGGLTNGLFFFSAAKQGTREALDRGADPGRALLYGSFTGAAEVLGETLSVEHLINLPESAPLWLNLLSQAFTEGSEEGFTTILNTLSDRAIMGDSSEFNRKIEENLANGMDYDSAVRSAWKSWTADLTADVVGGALSGGISGGIHTGISGVQSRQYQAREADRTQVYQLMQAAQSEEELDGVLEQIGENKKLRTAFGDIFGQDAAAKLNKVGSTRSSSQTRDEQASKAGSDLQNAFRQSGLNLSDNELDLLEDGYVEGSGDRTDYVIAMRDAYRLGRSGMSLEQAMDTSEESGKVHETQFRHAWELGQAAAKTGAASSRTAQERAGAQKDAAVTVRGQEGEQQIQELQRGEDGSLQALVRGQDGESRTVSLEDLDFAGNELGELIETIQGHEDAPQIYAAYQNGMPLSGLVDAWDTAKAYGRSTRSTSLASIQGDSLLRGVNADFVKAAFETGRKLRNGARGQSQTQETDEGRKDPSTPLRVAQDDKGGRRAMLGAAETGDDGNGGLAQDDNEGTPSNARRYDGRGESQEANDETKAERGKSGPSQSQSDSSPRRGASQEASREGKGGVSYDGATVGKLQLPAVNRNRLSPQQKAQIRVIETLGKKLGIRFVLYDSQRGGQKVGRSIANGMYQDGTIYLDVNAGKSRSLSNVALVRTAAHELTHYMQQFEEEGYRELQETLLDYLGEWKGKDLGQLVAEKMARDSTGTLTAEKALDEVVADGCEMMLRRTKVMERLANEKPGLFRQVQQWLSQWLDSVREAFQGVNAVHDEARAVEQMEAQRLQDFVELWDRTLLKAAEKAAKSPAQTVGEVKYQEGDELSYDGLPAEAFYTDKRIYSYDFLTAQKPMKISSMPPIPHWSMTAKDIRDNARESAEKNLAKVGKKDGNTYAVKNAYTGREIQVGMGAIRHSLAADNRADLVIKSRIISISGDLVQNAIPINGLVKENPQADGTYAMLGIATSDDATFAAVITVDQFSNVTEMEPIDVAHAINGRIKREDWSSSKDQPFRDNSSRLPQSSEITIAQVLDVVNETYKGILSDDVLKHFDEERPTTGYYRGRVLFQERDDLPEDRELLMATRAMGRNAEELAAYQKKVKSLEALQRKLSRQQEALESLREQIREIDRASGEEKGKAMAEARAAKVDKEAKAKRKLLSDALPTTKAQIEKTEASIRRAEKALADMERTPQIRREAEKALAAWREQNPNDAARAIREMRQERDSLKQYVKLLRDEARLTTPDTRRLLPSDVRRMAQNLIKEQGSSAAVDSISEKLQTLGDFLVSNMQGGDTSYYVEMMNRARQIAQEIVDESYETIDENREIREGIRGYLRNHTLRISDDVRGDIPDFERWRKSHMGTLRMGKEGMDIDQAYQDLRSEYGEGFFPADITARSDQLQQILDALEQVEPISHRMYNQYESWQAVEGIANEIVDRLLSGEVRERESMADKAFQRRMQQLEEKYAKKDRARQKALENAEDRAAWEARKRDEAEERRREEISLRRQLVAEKVHELRERSIERDRLYRGRIAIDKKVVALSKIMLENSGKRHVPDAWKETIGNFLASIDTLTARSGEKSRSFHLQRIEALQKMVERQRMAHEGREDGEGEGPQVFLDINPYIAEMLQPFVELAQDSSRGTIQVDQLSVEQMRALEEVLTAIREAVDKADQMLAATEKGETLSKTAGEIIEYLESLGKAKSTRYKWQSSVEKFMSWDNLTPVYFFKRFGPGGEKVFRELQRGWGQLAFNAQQIIKFTEGTYTSKEVREWEKETHEFRLVKRESDLGGRKSLTKAAAEGGAEAAKAAEEQNKETVTVSTAQLMGLYCLGRREQARGHILGGGIRIWDIEGKHGTTEQAERYLVTAEDIAEMTDALTERQKEVADKLQKYMNTVGSSWGNQVSRARYGVDLFTEENYYPITTDPHSRNARNPDADGTDLFHILNMGFTKNTVKNARNGVVLHSIFDVFSNHMADMAKYNAMGLPMLDAMKWFNYLDETDDSFTSTRKAMESAYGKQAERYFLGLIQDLNGSHEGGRRGEDIASRMISHSKVASVGANLRVAALQPTSYIRAMAVLDPKYMLIGENPARIRQGMREALQYSGTAVWKDLGFYDMNINANMRSLIKHADGTLEKIREFSMKGAEWGDKYTWAKLWNATKAEVKDKTGLSGEELLRATAERFDAVIYETQVMDSTMTRSHMMRQKGAFASMVTSFMSEPTLSYNLLLDAVSQWQRAKRGGQSKTEAGKRAARAFVVYGLSQVLASIVESVFSAMRDDDDYESFAEKWVQAEFGWDGNLMQDLWLHNKLPVVRDVVSILEGFSNKRMDTEWVEDFVRAYKAVKKDFEAGEIRWGTAYSVLRAMSTMSGLPMGNAARDSVALWNTFVVQNAPDWKLKNIKTGTIKPEASIRDAYKAGTLTEEEAVRYLMRDAEVESEEKARQKVFDWGLEEGQNRYDAMLEAISKGDSSKAAEARQQLMDNGFSAEGINSAVRSHVKEWYQGTSEDKRPRISKEKAIDMLVEQGGMRRREAEQTVLQWTSYVASPEHLQYDEIQEAYVQGEISAARAAEMRVLYGGKSKSEAKAEVLKWQCERDFGIKYTELEEAYLDGQITREQAVKMRMQYGGQSKSEAEQTLQEWTYTKDTGADYSKLRQSYVDGEISQEQAIQARMYYGGKTKTEAEQEIRKWRCEVETGMRYEEIEEAFVQGEISQETAVELRVKYGGQTKQDAGKTVQQWLYTKDTGADYDKLRVNFVEGSLTEQEAISAQMQYGGKTRVEAEADVLQWQCEKDTGIRYDNLTAMYVGGEIDSERAVSLRAKYGGKSLEEAQGEVLKWQCEKDTGVKYDNIRSSYLGKEMGRDQAKSMLVKYGGLSEEKAEAKLQQTDFIGRDPNLKDATEAAATKYYGGLEQAGISKQMWWEAYDTMNDMVSDKDSKGKTITDSLLKKRAAYIDSLPLTNAQKDLIFLTEYKQSSLRKTPWH